MHDSDLNVKSFLINGLGAKYFEWERKGVPLRLEVGPRDAKVTAKHVTVIHVTDNIATIYAHI